MAVIPLHHIFGLSVVLLQKLAVGAKIVVLPKFKPTTFLNALKEYQINLLYLAPPLFLFLGTHPDVKKEHLKSVEIMINGAAALPTSDIKKVLEKGQPNLIISQGYGLTEVSPIATLNILDSQDYTIVGFALPNTKLRVVDSNDKNLGPGKVGELHIRGPQRMKCYRNNPEATKNSITEDGWFKTGDLVSIDNDGAVTIVGRIKEIIKVKGYQVAPTELEGILKDHPDIVDAAVIGIPDERKGEVPKAFVILKEGHKTTANNIIEYVNIKVAEYKRLHEVEFIDALPKNSAGKILRGVLTKKHC